MAEKVKTAESVVSESAKEQYRDAKDIDSSWRERAIKGFRFGLGIQQWDSHDLAVLEAEGRPALTINLILPLINLLSGYQRRNRSDIVLYPRRGGTAPIAAVGTELIKHTLDTSDGLYDLSDAFYDGLCCGKGWLSVDKVFDNDPLNGDLSVEKESPFDLLADQYNKKYSVQKCQYVFKTYWWSKKKIELQYPRKAKDIGEAMESPDWEFDKLYSPGGDDYPEVEMDMPGKEESRHKTQYLIKERYYKKAEMVTFLVHKPTLSLRRLGNKKLIEQSKRLLTMGNGEYDIVERLTNVLYYSVHAGDMVLKHVKDPFDGICMFPYFRFCPYWVDGYVMGVVDNLIEPQMEVNKRRSQTLHHLNCSANSGWEIEKAKNKEAKKNLQKFGSKPGTILERHDFGGILKRIEPAKLDTGHLTLAALSSSDLQNISGINPSLLEQSPEGKESGKAKMLRQEAGLTVSEVIFDNLNRTQKELGEFLWEYIRRSDIYSEEEITAIVQEHNIKHFVDQSGEVDLSPLRNWQMGRYGVKVSRGSNLPTIRLANYEQLLAAMQSGLAIPPEYLIELSDLPNKDEILNYLKQAASALPAGQGAIA